MLRAGDRSAAIRKVTRDMNNKIARFLSDHSPETPCLVVDLDVIAEAYDLLDPLSVGRQRVLRGQGQPGAGDRRDAGADAARISMSRARPKSVCASATARPPTGCPSATRSRRRRTSPSPMTQGVRLFAFDSEAELEKLARQAPGARVFCRILVSCEGADWPLSRKFGCAPEMAVGLLHRARELGLDPYGVSFHVGSQQTDLGAMGPRGRRRGAHVHAARRDRHQPAHGQYRRRLSGAVPRRGRRDRALCAGRHRRADPAFRQPPARDHRRAGPLAGRRRRRRSRARSC